jgi:hypothetical protein
MGAQHLKKNEDRMESQLTVTKAELPRRADTSPLVPTEVHGEPAYDYWHGAETATGN